MLNIAFSYCIDGKEICDFLCSELKNIKSSWNLEHYPILGDGSDSTFFNSIFNNTLKSDVIVFVCTKAYIDANLDSLIKLGRLPNYAKKKIAFILVDTDLDNKNQISYDIKLLIDASIDYINSKETPKMLSELINYFNVVEIVVNREKEEKKRLKIQKQKMFNLLVPFCFAYIGIFASALSVVFWGQTSELKSSAEIILLITSLLSIMGIFLGAMFVVNIIRKKEDQKEKQQFDKELDISLSKASALKVEESTAWKLNTVSQEDNELSQAMGSDDYLPLGHLKFNWKQMKGYYDISKSQATKSFRWAIFFSCCGIAIIIFAILSPIIFSSKYDNVLISLIGSISGAIVELFAGTILVVYIKSLSQMNLYHKALSEYQRYLSCINLASKLSTIEKRDSIFEEIIREEIKKADFLDTKESKVQNVFSK